VAFAMINASNHSLFAVNINFVRIVSVNSFNMLWEMPACSHWNVQIKTVVLLFLQLTLIIY